MADRHQRDHAVRRGLPAAREFYSAAFGLPVHWEDADSAVFKFGDTLVNLLNASEARELIEPQPVGPANGGSRFQLTVTVDDVDATCTELADVLSSRLPTVADLPRLPYTEAVVLEALRLYPPAYSLSREAIKPTTVAGRVLPKGGIAFISVWATHRSPDIFEAPTMFRPERWLDGLARRLPRGAYLPFAEGPRKCIGASFAIQETVIVLATIARHFSFTPVAVQEIPLRPAVTLRPAEPIMLAVRARAARSDVASASIGAT